MDHISFNPRTHTGCDLHHIGTYIDMVMFQSTHPHGVRLFIGRSAYHQASFNPRTHTGCDYPCISSVCRSLNCFNPRTHTGCDYPLVSLSCLLYVSIHAPTRGATVDDYEFKSYINKFQSTHPHGVRPINFYFMDDDAPVSIHAPTRGAT